MSSSSSRNSGTVIPSGRVVKDTAPIRISVPQQGGAGNSGVRLEREGDLVRAIEVTCSCGEQIRLICDYQSASPTVPQPTFDSLQTPSGLGQTSGISEP